MDSNIDVDSSNKASGTWLKLYVCIPIVVSGIVALSYPVRSHAGAAFLFTQRIVLSLKLDVY